MSKRYFVSWEIDIDGADTPREAAEKAWEIMRRADSTANVFKVIECDADGESVTVDLSEEEEHV